MSLDSHHTQYLIINSKCIKDLTRIGKNLKLSEENIEKNLYDIGFVNNLIKITLRAHATKNKKFDFIKLKTFVERESEKPSFITEGNILKSFIW